jgi:glycogen phosphorylase
MRAGRKITKPKETGEAKAGFVNELKRAFAYNLFYRQGVPPQVASINDYYMAVAYTVRDRLQHLWINSTQSFIKERPKMVCYFSAEFLTGPHLANNLINMGIYEQVKQAAAESGLDLQELIAHEAEPGLGNGGLGRLAACYLDSLATLGVPAIGYGIRYEFGIFNQAIENGWQVEYTDKWLAAGNPWEIPKTDITFPVKFGGHTEAFYDEKGRYRVRWNAGRVVNGVAYDTPVPGYKSNTVDFVRLWRAEAPESFDFQEFNVGDYYGAVEEKVAAENITKVLYPNDEQLQGKELRLQQQYFFVSCSLQDMIRIQLIRAQTLETFSDFFAAQLNDTHPAIAVAELMRLLIDEHNMGWDLAWDITCKTFAYTNHTLLPEALEKWPLEMFGRLLPRLLEIIYEINWRFLDQVRSVYPADDERLARMSIIDESGCRYVRMAHLACVGSHAINGVAALHTELLKKNTLADFYQLWPEKFKNITNGVTPRRWMAASNPGLARLITSRIGSGWITNLDQLSRLEEFADDPDFLDQWRLEKVRNKQRAAEAIFRDNAVVIDPESMFDVQVKRIHEYKRQHLNVLHMITLYRRIKEKRVSGILPRTFIFGGKAAPGYFMAKLIIKLISSVAEVINNDPEVNHLLKVVFIPNYNVKRGQWIYPVADLSEQISTAGKEASGTGNMKFSMNGALTIGTLDGANIEIREEVGAENCFLFGMTAQEVSELRAAGYDPRQYYHGNDELRGVVDLIAGGHFSHDDRQLFRPLLDELLNHDEFMLLADYQSYIDCQDRVGRTFGDKKRWTRMSLLNVARIGKFSSDRAVGEYCRNIWHASPSPVTPEWQEIPETGFVFQRQNEARDETRKGVQ